MNEIFELRSEIEGLKKQIRDRLSNENNIYDNNNLEILKVQNPLLQKENQSVEHELQENQLVIEKLLDIKTIITTPMTIHLKLNLSYDFQNKKQNQTKKDRKPIKDVKIKLSNNRWIIKLLLSVTPWSNI